MFSGRLLPETLPCVMPRVSYCTVWYKRHHCIRHTMLHCIIHQTSLYHTPPHTRSPYHTIHHPSLYHIPYVTISYTSDEDKWRYGGSCIIGDGATSLCSNNPATTRHLCIIHQTLLYQTPDIAVSYTRHHSHQGIIHHTWGDRITILLSLGECFGRRNHLDEICSSVIRVHDSIVHRTQWYDTPNISVWYTKHQRTTHTRHHTHHSFAMYHSPNINVPGTKHHFMIVHTPLRCTTRQAYTRHQSIINQTSLYHTPHITVSYTRHHCIIHQTSLYHTQPPVAAIMRNFGCCLASLYHVHDGIMMILLILTYRRRHCDDTSHSDNYTLLVHVYPHIFIYSSTGTCTGCIHLHVYTAHAYSCT